MQFRFSPPQSPALGQIFYPELLPCSGSEKTFFQSLTFLLRTINPKGLQRARLTENK